METFKWKDININMKKRIAIMCFKKSFKWDIQNPNFR